MVHFNKDADTSFKLVLTWKEKKPHGAERAALVEVLRFPWRILGAAGSHLRCRQEGHQESIPLRGQG